jgi:hypothetical protein
MMGSSPMLTFTIFSMAEHYRWKGIDQEVPKRGNMVVWNTFSIARGGLAPPLLPKKRGRGIRGESLSSGT